MKRLFTIVALLWLAYGAGAQQVVQDDFGTLRVDYVVANMRMTNVSLDGQKFVALAFEGGVPSAEVGAPCLPLFSSLIEVPLCDDFEVVVSATEYDTLKMSQLIAPLQPSRSKSDTARHKMEYNASIYGADAYHGTIGATVESLGIARDRRLARLHFAPLSYNPTTGQLVVCRKATVTVRYRGADRAGSMALFERYHSPAFHSGAQVANSLYPKSVRTAAPVRYLIVAHSMFRGQLDNFVQWKRRKGFITDIVYTDDAAVGTTTTSIQAYIQSQYTGATTASPAPTYLLIVGDHEQIPAFTGTTSSDHITDLYYTTWTSGDHLPDCYYGRFSAQSIAQLTPQVDKTLMYEQYTFADPSFLDRAVMVAGVDGGSSGDYGYTHADPAMDYAITNYVNGVHGFSQVMYFKNNTSIVPTGSNVTTGSSASSNSATVRGYYNQGAGLINYSAHGSATSWGTPNFTTSHAAAMTNTQKFGLMIGNCCLTNKFETTTCLGESVLRKGDYCGAVGYIGGSNSTYWYEDFYWAVGVRSSIGPSMSMAYDANNLGVYDRVMHTHGEDYSQWALTQGDMMFQGNMSVEGSSSGRTHYYWEIYHLMGDPSVMPYLTQASEMTLTAPSTILFGVTTLSVTAAPYAYVALTDTATRTLQAAAYANASGQATLTLPSGMAVGGYELAASAQQRRTAFQTISVVPSSGPYATIVAVTAGSAVNAGNTVPLTVKVANLGNSIAHNVTLSLTSANANATVTGGSVSVGNIAAGDTVTVGSVSVNVSSTAADQSSVVLNGSTNWTGAGTAVASSATLTVNAPVVTVSVADGARNVVPGNSLTLNVTIANSGHAAMGSSRMTIATGSSQLTGSAANSGYFTLAAGASLTRQFTLTAAATMTEGNTVQVYLTMSGAVSHVDTLDIYIGEILAETFENGFVMNGWIQGTYPWQITSDSPAEGSYCARSYSSLTHNQTSELSMNITVSRNDSISFWYKVSSESNYDKFHFYIDGTEKMVTSGQVAWTRAAYAIAPGSHTIMFTYSKDGSVSSYSDCAWIDNIALPRPVPSYTVSVTAPHGTATGAGTYFQGDTASVGVYPNAGYAFIRWNDGNTLNPRSMVVSGNVSLTATLSQGGGTTVYDTTVVTVHDTTIVMQHDTTIVMQHDTTIVMQHDTAYVDVHDTSYVTVYDTVYQTQYVHDTVIETSVLHDTLYVVDYVHDTTYIDGLDTLYLTQYVHDTTVVTEYVTLTVHDTVFMPYYLYDTIVVTEYDTVTELDTVTLTVEVPVHDTTVVEIMVHDTTYVVDTMVVVDTLYLYDTLWVYDTVYLYDTVYIHDTVYVPVDAIDGVAATAVNVYQTGGTLVVESVDGSSLPTVTVYDAIGRRLTGTQGNTGAATDSRFTFAVPASGVYLVRVGDAPARRVAVVR